MTAINWLYVDDTTLAMVTDTKVSGDDGGICGPPVNFSTKLFPLPHLHAVLCGTGSLHLLLDWFSFVESNAIGKDIGILVELAPKHLPDLARARHVSAQVVTTVYHAGYDREGTLRCYAHRSTSGFVAEELPAGFMMKPAVPELREWFINEVDEKRTPLPVAFVELIARQRAAANLADDPAERVGIGGEVHFLLLNQHIQTIWSCYRFEDFDEEFAKVLEWAASLASTVKRTTRG